MRRDTPKLEWHIAENDEEWEQAQAQLTPAVMPQTGYRLYVQMYAGNAIALMLVLVGAWWRISLAEKTQGAATATIATPSASSGLTLGPSSVMEVINTSQGQNALPPATPDLLGQWYDESLATPYFLYHFRQQDAAVVRTAAPQIDAIYVTLWRNLGLSISLIPERLVIDVRTEQMPGKATMAFDTQRPVIVPSSARYLMPGDPPTNPGVTSSVTVPSPVLYRKPVALRDVDLLAQSIALPLLAQGLAQAREVHQIGPDWQPLVDGLYLWQLWDLYLPLATWRETVVRWQYRDLPATQPGQVIPLPPRYQELCAAHKLWMQSPVQIHIPLLCTGHNQENGYWHTWRSDMPSTLLAQLAVPSPLALGEGRAPVGGPPFFTNHPGQTVALTTLIEYAMATYGRERLPVLVAGLGQYDRWDTLLPAVFGVSAAEFEAGWQAYLPAHYGVATQP